MTPSAQQHTDHRARALKAVSVADHMLSVTYPLLKDPKLLLAVLDNISKSLEANVASLVTRDRTLQLVPACPPTFDAQYTVFKRYLVRRYALEETYIGLIDDVRSIIKQHKDSSIEFSRKGRFVICNEDYSLQTLNAKEIKTYLKGAKDFSDAIGRCHERST
ncbi:MAG: hypothetical protein ABIH41_05150 [Nanoarchaeota archaeon]